MVNEFINQDGGSKETDKGLPQLVIILPPDLTRLVVLDLRLSDESAPLIKGVATRDFLPEQLCRDISLAIRNNREDLVEGCMPQVLALTRNYLDKERPELSSKGQKGFYVFWGSVEVLYKLPLWQKLKGLAVQIGKGEELEAETNMLLLDEYGRAKINAVFGIGYRTLWSRSGR